MTILIAILTISAIATAIVIAAARASGMADFLSQAYDIELYDTSQEPKNGKTTD